VPTTSVPLSAKVSSPCAPVAVDDSQDEACVSDDHRSRGEVSRVYHRWEDAAIGVLANRKRPRRREAAHVLSAARRSRSTEYPQRALQWMEPCGAASHAHMVTWDASCGRARSLRLDLRKLAEGFTRRAWGGERASGESLPTMRRFTPCPSWDTSCASDVHPT